MRKFVCILLFSLLFVSFLPSIVLGEEAPDVYKPWMFEQENSPKPKNKYEGFVSFTFDDGLRNTFSTAYPILKEYGYPATVYICTGRKQMSTEELHILHENGWEIASHTVNHAWLTRVGDEKLDYELKESKSWLLQQGLEGENFACPFGAYNERTVKAVERYYASHRTAFGGGINTLPLKNGFQELKGEGLERHLTLERMKNWVRRAKKEEGWLILVFHQIGGESRFSWSVEKFRALVQFVHDEGLCVVTVTEGVKRNTEKESFHFNLIEIEQ